GRLKEMLVIRGRNHYPHDIEQTSGSAHARLEPGGAAAFAVIVGDEERLVVVQEMRRGRAGGDDYDEVFRAGRAAGGERHDLDLHALVFIRYRTLPRTSSGKIQRLASRAAYLDGTLDAIARWPHDRVAAGLRADAQGKPPELDRARDSRGAPVWPSAAPGS